MDSGRALYEAHKVHMARRKIELGYFNPDCSACKIHQQKDKEAVEKRTGYYENVDQSRTDLTQRHRLRHQGD